MEIITLKPTKTCKQCLQPFLPAKKAQRFCSNTCSGKYRQKPIDQVHYVTIHKYLARHNTKRGVCSHCDSGRAKRTEWALRKGRTYSRNIDDYIELCSSCHKFYDMTDEAKQNMSKAHRGAERPWRRKPVVCINAKGERADYQSITIAARLTGIHRVGIQHALVGRAKTAGGNKWKYA